MNSSTQFNPRWWLWLGLGLTLFKLWLTRAQPIFAIGNATLDDRLFLELARSLVCGEWLGPYDETTLAKGPAYPLFIALVFYLGLPLGLAQQALYAGACALFARACRPVLSAGACCGVYLFLLWNPMSYEAATLGRIMRQHLATPLGIIMFAGLVALYLRRTGGAGQQTRWACLLGFSAGLFWLTREESIWIAPSMAILAAAFLVGAWRSSPIAGRTALRSLVTALACALLPVLLVSWQNHRHYGWFGTVEFRAQEFKAAYGALQRVKIGPNLLQVPVTRQAREALYPLSPTMALLEPWLEREAWTDPGLLATEGRQIRGGWFMWALRESVARAGLAPDAHSALQYYQKLADEVNALCDSGKIPSRPRRDSLVPRWHEGQPAAVARTVLWFTDFVAGFASFTPYTPLSIGDREELKLFHDLTGDQLSSSIRAPVIEKPSREGLHGYKLELLHAIGSHLCSALFVVYVVSLVILPLRIGQCIRRRQPTYPLVLAIAALGGLASFLLINAMVHVLSFPLIAVSTFGPVYPLLLIFYVALIWDVNCAWFSGQQRDSALQGVDSRLAHKITSNQTS